MSIYMYYIDIHPQLGGDYVKVYLVAAPNFVRKIDLIFIREYIILFPHLGINVYLSRVIGMQHSLP